MTVDVLRERKVRAGSSAGSLPAGLLGKLAILAGALCATAAAQAADRAYWSNAGGPGIDISFANLDGSGGGDLDTSGAAQACCASGAAIDLAAGRIYWANDGADTISFANLDGSGGGGDLDTAGATVDAAYGVAIDPVARRIYWPNLAGKISFAGLDGGGGGDLDTTGATVSSPQGLAVDPAAGRVYWTNNGAGPGTAAISFVDLGTGMGDDLDTTGATVSQPEGVAIDPAAGRIYWTNYFAGRISFANLDGSGGGDLATGGATLLGPVGAAIDPPAGRIYWANYNGDTISFADLNRGGGADLRTAGATVSAPNFVALVQSPRAAGAPAIAGGTEPVATLSCSDGSWAPDLAGAFLYRSPTGFSRQWTLDGTDIAGATTNSLDASIAGDYRCRVTAANPAGAASQTSEAHALTVPAGKCIAPNVVGAPLADAKAAIKKNRCRSAKLRRTFSSQVAAGRVVSQRPEAGTRRKKGARVRLVVSRGGRR